MTKEKVLKLAINASKKQDIVLGMACININGLSNEEKLDLNVRLKIAHDEACAAQKEYSDAFNEYYAGLKESTK